LLARKKTVKKKGMCSLLMVLRHASEVFAFSLVDCLELRCVSRAVKATVDDGGFEMYWRAWIPLLFTIRGNHWKRLNSRKRASTQLAPEWFPRSLLTSNRDVFVRFYGSKSLVVASDSDPGLENWLRKLRAYPIGTPIHVTDVYRTRIRHYVYRVGATCAFRYLLSYGKPKLATCAYRRYVGMMGGDMQCYKVANYRCMILDDERFDQLIAEKHHPGSLAFKLYLHAVVAAVAAEAEDAQTKLVERVAKAQEELDTNRNRMTLARSMLARFDSDDDADDDQPLVAALAKRKK
jgi:hypothetical protein